ncbi:hypothetical protein ALC62_08220 [Cyphomyrmex costatus]|uniref:Uncharacterized protein n=1 Tax=Cyphomyrmex costatus TaxID=456900 RepID=A0A195CLP6_9HYME|nr:hypothetical protein ALC62_08220 [Cyphomyrmex costatus]
MKEKKGAEKRRRIASSGSTKCMRQSRLLSEVRSKRTSCYSARTLRREVKGNEKKVPISSYFQVIQCCRSCVVDASASSPMYSCTFLSFATDSSASVAHVTVRSIPSIITSLYRLPQRACRTICEYCATKRDLIGKRVNIRNVSACWMQKGSLTHYGRVECSFVGITLQNVIRTIRGGDGRGLIPRTSCGITVPLLRRIRLPPDPDDVEVDVIQESAASGLMMRTRDYATPHHVSHSAVLGSSEL